MSDIYADIASERERQDDKWGEQNHPNVDRILIDRPSVTDKNGRTWSGGCTPQRMAEHYEIPTAGRAKFLCQNAADFGVCTWSHILIEEVAEAIEAATMHGMLPHAETLGALRDELIQVAAVAVQWVEKLDREDDS